MDIYSKNCFTLMNAFMAVIKNIGIPTAEDKKKRANNCVNFLRACYRYRAHDGSDSVR